MMLQVTGEEQNSIVCVFSRAKNDVIPAFCNKVTASSKLTSVTTAQVETIGGMTVVSERTDTPAALKYEISVTPDANSASGYADGIVSTTFTVSVMEGRSDGAQTNQFNDVICVDGGNACKEYAQMIAEAGFPEVRIQAVVNQTTHNLDHFNILVGGEIQGRIDNTGTPGTSDIANALNTMMNNADDGKFVDLPDYLEKVFGTGPGGILDARGTRTVNTNDFYIPSTLDITPTLAGFDELASTLTYVDTATVAGGISTFNKVFAYQSGANCENC